MPEPAGFRESLAEVQTALKSHPGFQHICIAPEIQSVDGVIPPPSLWVYGPRSDVGFVEKVADVSARVGVPVELVDHIEDTTKGRRTLAPPGDNPLFKRANPPSGGYQIGPLSPRMIGTFGLLGFVNRNRTRVSAMITAAHTFIYEEVVTKICRQPRSESQADIIAVSCDLRMQSSDILAFYIEEDARDWEKTSNVAYLGKVTHYVYPDLNLKVMKVGCKTGLTHGKIIGINQTHFRVVSTNSERFSEFGDSGSAVVTRLPGGDLGWVGILLGRNRNRSHIKLCISQETIRQSLGFNLFS